MAVDCTKLSRMIYEYYKIALNAKGAKNFDEAAKIIMARFPGLDKVSISEAIMAVRNERQRLAKEQQASRENVTQGDLKEAGVTDPPRSKRRSRKRGR